MNLPALFQEFSLTPNGVVCCGAFEGDLLHTYQAMAFKNVLMIEPNPEPFRYMLAIADSLADKFADNGCQSLDCVPCAAMSYDGLCTLNYMSNSQSASVMQVGAGYKRIYPERFPVGNFTADCRRIETIMADKNLMPSNYDYYHFDVDGAELSAIEGIPWQPQAVSVRVSFEPLYEGEKTLAELDHVMRGWWLERVKLIGEDRPEGFAFYVKKRA